MKKRSVMTVMLALFLLLCSCNVEESGGEGVEYVFESGEARVSVGDDADEVLAALGEYRSSHISPSCASEGEEIMYVYDGFRITSAPCGERNFIYIIELTSDAVSTPEGISVGAARDEVVSAYGYGYRAVGESLEYRSDTCILQFVVREGRVSSVRYIAADKQNTN